MSADSAGQQFPDVIPLAGRTSASPDAARKLLGVHLRRLRTQRGWKLKDVAPVIRASPAKISRLERGESPPKRRDVMDLVELYEVTGQEAVAEICTLLELATEDNWWDTYSDVMPHWMQRLIGLEDSATEVRTWQTMVVPGLLQTPEYARTIIRSGITRISDDEVARRVALRVRRQQILHSPGRPQVMALLDEGVLARAVGGPQVMVEQLRYLRSLDRTPQVNVRIVTCAKSSAAGLLPPPMTYLRYNEGGPKEIVLLEHADGATYVNRPAGVVAHRDVVERLMLAAEDRASSLELIDRAITDLTRQLRS